MLNLYWSLVLFHFPFFFISLGILMSVLLISKKSFIIKDVNHLSCIGNEILCIYATSLLWCSVFWLCIKI
uniref:Uncharacterized protein n=1 Tax=Sus scrofa TaxID=9823 RepID=A0A4X1UNI9_PIG